MVDPFKSEVSEEFTKAYVNLGECEKDKDIKEESASAYIDDACDELVTPPLLTDRCVEEDDLAKKVSLDKKIYFDDEELYNLREMNLQVISIGAWLLIQRATLTFM